jgi:hypothetical protein
VLLFEPGFERPSDTNGIVHIEHKCEMTPHISVVHAADLRTEMCRYPATLRSRDTGHFSKPTEARAGVSAFFVACVREDQRADRWPGGQGHPRRLVRRHRPSCWASATTCLAAALESVTVVFTPGLSGVAPASTAAYGLHAGKSTAGTCFPCRPGAAESLKIAI